MPPADEYLDVAGARLRFRDEGAGAAIVFVHGWTLDLDVWQPQRVLASGVRVVCYDRRGFGLSSGDPALAQDAEDLRALLARLQINNPLLVGASQGARIVLELAANHPQLARGVVLDGPPPIDALAGCADGDLPMDEFRAAARTRGIDEFRRLWRAHPMTRLFGSDRTAHSLLSEIIARYPGRDLLLPAEERPGLDDLALSNIRPPALVINGAHDVESRRAAGLALAAKLPAATHVSVANAGHLPNLDAPREYNRILSDFARRVLPAAA